jgi:hypothetical protein
MGPMTSHGYGRSCSCQPMRLAAKCRDERQPATVLCTRSAPCPHGALVVPSGRNRWQLGATPH